MAKQVDSTNIGTLLEALITKIKSFFWRKDETSELPIDNTPTGGSNNLVKSGGVYSSLQGIRQLKVLNLGNFTPSHGSVTLGTKAEAAVALNITEAQVDSLLNCEYDYIEFNTAFFGGFKSFSVPSYGSGYMCIGSDEHNVMMVPRMLNFRKMSDVYSYDFYQLGIKDVTVGGESVIGSGSQESVAVIPAIPDVSQFITRSVNDLANYYLKSETYTQTEVNNLIGAIQQFHYEIAASTSAVTSPSNNVLYLIGPTGSGADKYEEYVYSNGWVKIGDTSIDLSGYVTIQVLNNALAGKQDTIDSQHKLDYSLIANTPTIPPADYVSMIDITSSTDESGNVKQSAAIVSGTFAEIDAALLAQKTVLLIGRIPDSNPVSYRYFRSGEHMPGSSVFFASIGADMIPGAINVAVWYHGDSAGPERVEMYDGTGIMDAFPMGDGNAVTSIERHNLFPALIANKDKTFVDTAEQTLTDAQKSQARTNIGAGTYSKPSGGIPASDIADGVIPDVSSFITKSVNDLVNYYKKTETYTKTEVDNLIGAIQSFHYEIAASTSVVTNPQSNALYLIGPTGTGSDKYEEYVYTTEWVKIGDTSIDLSGYVTTQALNTALSAYTTTNDLTTLLAGKQDTIDVNNKLDYSLLSNTPTIPAAPVNADWNASSGLAQILNKPTIPAAQVNSDWNATSGLAQILNKPTIPAAQVPADWDATTGVSRILNKPTIPTQYAGSPTAGGFANKAVAIPYGEVDATSTATALTATVDNFPTTLVDGVCAYIRNNAVASASGFTLNINGTGAKPVYQTLADASRSTTIFAATTTYLFVYNSSRVEGGCWDIYYGYNSNDNTVGYNLRTNGASAPPAAQKYYRYRLLFMAADNQSLVPANTSSSTNATAAKTVNQTKIDPFGVIFYYSYTSAVNAGANPNASYLWMQYNGISLGYSFNRTGEALEMTARDPVYLKCAPQSDGSAIIDADNPIVQALPTTADGKIYIFLGFAESATAITLYYWHPVYYHDGTKICMWTGVTTNSGNTETDEYLSKYLTFEVLSPGTIEWRTAAFTPSSAKKINYRINNGAWVESVTPSGISSVTNTDAIIFVSQGDIVEISGVGTNPTGGLMATFFAGTARFKAYGNIMSLIGGDDFVGLKTITVYRAFANLFSDCVGLVDASNLRLPATTLSSNCYEQMFMGCTSLTMPPMMLPATTLHISCYSSMFKNCTALTNVPVILATTLEMRCCDSMFYGCTSITASPSLRVISLANYCFENMFYGCTNLNYVIALFTDTPGSNYTDSWLYGVSATGTFVKNSSATWDVSGSSGIPSGWTVETTSR